MTADTLKDLCLCGETTRVQFKEMFTSQKEAAKEMIAFVNTKGGVILFGVEDKTGVIKGLSYDEIQQTSRELGNAAQELVKPTIYIETEIVKVEGKHVLVCSIEEGRNKPYKNLQGEIWVKQGADKRRITENAEILSLFQSSGNYHPEEDPEKGTTVDDLEMADLRDFFRRVYGREIEDFDQPLESMLKSLGILTAEGEVTRAGMLFFGRDPQHFEHSVVLKAVAFQGNDIGDTNYLDSRDITGTLPRMFKEGMAFLKSYLRHEQRGQNFNSTGILEISEVALEELLQNALVHFDLLNHAAIRLLIFSNRVEIINPGCLYGGLRVEDIKLGVSRQRNPLMAELAARTMIYRGLGSGIIRVMRENTPIEFDNQESADQFKVTVWRTAQKGKVTTQRGKNTTQKNEVSTQKGVLTTQKRPESTQKKENSTQKKILEYLRVHPQATRLEVSKTLGDITEDGVKYAIARLQEKGLLERVGGRKQGEWIVKDKND